MEFLHVGGEWGVVHLLLFLEQADLLELVLYVVALVDHLPGVDALPAAVVLAAAAPDVV